MYDVQHLPVLHTLKGKKHLLVYWLNLTCTGWNFATQTSKFTHTVYYATYFPNHTARKPAFKICTMELVSNLSRRYVFSGFDCCCFCQFIFTIVCIFRNLKHLPLPQLLSYCNLKHHRWKHVLIIFNRKNWLKTHTHTHTHYLVVWWQLHSTDAIDVLLDLGEKIIPATDQLALVLVVDQVQLIATPHLAHLQQHTYVQPQVVCFGPTGEASHWGSCMMVIPCVPAPISSTPTAATRVQKIVEGEFSICPVCSEEAEASHQL